MFKYIITNGKEYQYPRAPLENGLQYESRTSYGPDIDKARLFTTKSAASNSLGYKGNYRRGSIPTPPKDLKIVKVKVTLEIVETYD
jgi:hypothetical protein